MATHIEDEPTKDLVTGVLGDIKDLATGHIGRMQSEISAELKNLKAYMLKVAVAVGVVVVGAVLVGLTLALGITALGVPSWIGHAIAAGLMTIAGFKILKRLPGEKKEMDLVPEDSFGKLKDDLRDVGDAVRH